MMKFLADMCISVSIVEFLRENGYDVVRLSDENLEKLPDTEVFEKAVRENRIILTFDLDFSEIVSKSEGSTISVILFRLHNTRSHFVMERLKQVLFESSDNLEKGSVIIIDDHRFRIRNLPI